ncbi:MAG: TonB-dependent receptor, partial [Flavobacteriaceae bacterium]|nr:TonB-dependent receptor [Flavobacteriaceae bacterium]
FPIILFAQSKAITGTVVDENKMPLPGASILVKGLNIGSSTDFDGNFSLNVPETGEVLVVSYLGYMTKELVISKNLTFNIQLDIDTNTLDEIVVVGYGTQRKSDITGSVTSVKVDAIAVAQNSTIDALLQGRAAGVQVTQNAGSPGSGVSVKIRGASSLRGNNEPLYVIDGVIISSAGEDASNASADANSLEETQNGLNGINPRDIESIEVLKDASATAIYGSRGANGVILITTKKGKSGKTSIQAYVNTSVSEITERYDILDALGYANYQNEALAVNGGDPRFSIIGDDIFPIAADGTVSDTAAEQHNWHDEIYKQGFSRSAGASFSGGTEKGNFYASVGYNDQGGIVENSRLKNGNFSINLNQDLSDKLTINTKLNAFYSTGNFAQDGDRAGGQRSFVGNILRYPTLVTNGGTFDNEDGISSPFTWVNDFQDTSEESRFIGSLALTYKFNIKGLKYKLQAGGNIRNKERRRFYGLTTFQGSSTNGSLSISNLESKSYQINNLLTYNRTFNKKHRINAVIGMTYDVRDIKNTLYAVNDFSTTEFGVDQPIYGQQISRPLDVLPLKSQLLSYLSRVNYSFDNKYIITGTFRADGSSKFSNENRYSYFPSFSLAWRANNENFLKNSDTINDLKFRIGWGMTGNQGISAYQTFANYGPTLYGNLDEGTSIGFVPLNVSNPNLKWETTKQLNFGLDFGLWKNRVTGTLDIYDKQTDDLLLNQPLGPSSGFTSLLVNRGSINNKGVELTLSGTLINKNDFSIDLGGNIAFNKSKIQNLGGSSEDIYINGTLENRVFYRGQNISTGNYFRAPANIFMEGEQIGLFYGYETDGIYQTEDDITVSGAQAGDVRIVDQDGDDTITEADRTLIGNPNPDFVYGGYLNMNYKRLSLSVQINGVYGNEIVNGNLIQLGTAEGRTANVLSEAYNNAWRPDAQSNSYPRVGYLGESGSPAITDRIIEDGSFLRISNITLGYDIPVEKTNVFSSANVYVSGMNLFTFTDYSGYNPEITNFMNNGNVVGVDWNGFPNAQTIMLGLNLKF